MEQHIAAFKKQYHDIIVQTPLPKEIADNYEVHDCLHETKDKAVYLVRSRLNGKLYILKIYSAYCKEDIEMEYRLLSELSHPSIPHSVMFLEQDNKRYMIREYIKGTTLAQLVDENGPLEEKIAVEIACEICATLEYLHTHNPPIIHRDIKPQNIILSHGRQCSLIDFGIARLFHDDSGKDTVFMGTEATAAPEQFGYMQTGVRSDIYSMGILLLFLLTGSFDIKRIHDVQNKNLRKIVVKCTRFDPANRYSSISRLQNSLKRLYTGKKVYMFAAVFCAFMLGIVVGVYWAKSNFNITNHAKEQLSGDSTAELTTQPDAAYIFQSPLIEKAARQELGIDENSVITEEDLDSITRILICGNKVFSDWNDYNISGTDGFLNNASDYSAGTINTLEDIGKMKNITELALYDQQITDITPLKDLPLVKLGLADNHIQDLSALSQCGTITDLLLTNNPITDVSPLSQMSALSSLDLANTDVEDIEPLVDCPIFFVSLIDAPVKDYSVLTRLPDLEWLRASNLAAQEVEIISGISRFKDLTMHNSEITSLDLLSDMTGLLFLDLYQCKLSDIDGIDRFPSLGGLCIANNPITDLTPITSLTDLSYLNIINIEANFTPLGQLPELNTIDCSKSQKDDLREVLAGTDTKIRVQD